MSRFIVPFALLVAAGTLAPAVAHPDKALPSNIAAAAADPARDGAAAQDAARHGPEILAFAGVRPGATVIDLIPGGGYWTRLFAKAVGPKGHVYGIWPAPYAAEAARDVTAYETLAKDARFGNISSSTQPVLSLAAPAKADLVFTAQNYHDYPDKFMGRINPATLNRLVFDALKPGGIYLVIDHRAAPGSGLRDTDTLHRIDAAAVRSAVVKAGFKFVGESGLLANPADDHTKLVFDKSLRGHTDQFIYKFRKPGGAID